MTTQDPNRPFDPVTGLPADPGQARDELRRRLVEAWSPVLQDSGLRYQSARFATHFHTDGAGWWDGSIVVNFGVHPESEWPQIEQAMARAAAQHGWGQAGVSHALNLRRGPLQLRGACSVNGCSYVIETGSRITQEVAPVLEGYTLRVEELEAYLDPAAPTPTRR